MGTLTCILQICYCVSGSLENEQMNEYWKYSETYYGSKVSKWVMFKILIGDIFLMLVPDANVKR